ncbi:hypothetical protein AJ78_08766 [Emergomyces pasteurianus Ep9510]|uniref:Uncharacterized protein n=1 Tax=Emergomyces pasteurianus Ep9510 TaxID=1447872 RepID=A0A1J9P1L9_9EURO|nr:hypothetical protein AJ78_08766 [Emergomyces pasteurianus Ep9510]
MNKNEIPLIKSTFIKHVDEMNEMICCENTRRGRVEYLHILDPDYLFKRLEAIAVKYHNEDMTGYEGMRTKMLAKIKKTGMPKERISRQSSPVFSILNDNSPDDNSPDDNSPDNNSPDDNSPVNNSLVNNSLVDNSLVDNSPVDNSPVDNSPVDNSPVNNSPVDNSPVDNSPDDNSPNNNSFDNDNLNNNCLNDNSSVFSIPDESNPASGIT